MSLIFISIPIDMYEMLFFFSFCNSMIFDRQTDIDTGIGFDSDYDLANNGINRGLRQVKRKVKKANQDFHKYAMINVTRHDTRTVSR